jgi:hypothetical protein
VLQAKSPSNAAAIVIVRKILDMDESLPWG